MAKTVLLSEEIEELIHHRPHWLIRHGSLFFLLLLLGVVAASWFVRVPLTVHCSMRVFLLDDRCHGEMRLSRVAAAGVRSGQMVVVPVDGGRLTGHVGSVSLLTSALAGDSVLVNVRLFEVRPEGGRMDGGRTVDGLMLDGRLPLDRPMPATILADSRLFDRWFGTIAKRGGTLR